jgi:pyridoxal phosphate enzyme (YggS family)
METIKEQFLQIRQSIEKQQQQSLLAQKPVCLIAVSKAQTVDAIGCVIGLGQKDFGENRVQEAADKWPPLLEKAPEVRLHLIGSLQTNKVKEALSLFHTIQTIDRPHLVDAIIKERKSDSRTQEFFIQVNTGEEEQKGGVAPQETARLLEYCRKAGLPVTGLMCVPPVGVPAAPHFALLYKMAQEMGLASLSMGMSGDYEVAIRLGATHVRVGTALFGQRI